MRSIAVYSFVTLAIFLLASLNAKAASDELFTGAAWCVVINWDVQPAQMQKVKCPNRKKLTKSELSAKKRALIENLRGM